MIPRLVKACSVLNKHWDIYSMPGAEITHAPLGEIAPLVRYARRLGAMVVVVHGETISEPVIKGTNACAIDAGCDILAHPGLITAKDAKLAKKNGTFLEITSRKSHMGSNRHVVNTARSAGAGLILNNDAHMGDNLISKEEALRLLSGLGCNKVEIGYIFRNSEYIVESVQKVRNKKAK